MKEYRNLRIAPFSGLLDSTKGGPDHQGGPDFDEWDEEIQSRHCRFGSKPIDIRPLPLTSKPIHIEEDSAYLGPICNHFGHQICDFSMRILPTQISGFKGQYLFAVRPSSSSDLGIYPTFMEQLVRYFDLPKDKIKILNQDSVVDRCFIAPQSETAYGPAPSCQILDALDMHNFRKLGRQSSKFEVVYISRARLSRGIFLGEVALESFMRRAGATVIYPELETIESLLKIYSSAKYIVGAEGSAFHTIQLLGRQLKNVVVIRRRCDAAFFGSFLQCRAEKLSYVDAVVGGISGLESGRYREAGLIALSFDMLKKQLNDILPIKLTWSDNEIRDGYEESLSRWLFDYWHRTPTFGENSVEIILQEARSLGVEVDSDDVALARKRFDTTVPVPSFRARSKPPPISRRLRATLSNNESPQAKSSTLSDLISECAEELSTEQIGDIVIALYSLGDFTGSERAVQLALERTPNVYWLWQHQAHLQWRAGRLTEAICSVKKALSLESRPQGYDLLVRISEEAGYLQAALWAVNQLISGDVGSEYIAVRKRIIGKMNIDTANAPRKFSTHSSRRISRIAELTQAQSYLEIGVSEGVTFNDVALPRKVAVDPQFRFDTALFRAPGIDFHEVPSDEFFLKLAASEKFDIIFLDGLHTFQQTMRDFLNSLAHANDKTVWLIDDVFPRDVFSSLPISADAHRFRIQSGDSNLAWHGDVYKLPYFINDFMPSFSFATCHTGGNPQTIVWKAPAANWKSFSNSAEVIERMSYFEFKKSEEVLRLVSEDEALRLLSQWFA